MFKISLPIRFSGFDRLGGNAATAFKSVTSRPANDRFFCGDRPNEADISRAREILRRAEARQKTAFGDLFSDPAWMISLDLLVREHEGLQTSVSSACIASLSTSTTASRYVDVMICRGLIMSHTDPVDQCRIYLTLSDNFRRELVALLRD